MTVTEPASARSEDVRDGYGRPKERPREDEDEGGWPRGMPDPASPGNWPHDGPQPPYSEFVLTLDQLDASTATFVHRNPSDGTSAARLALSRDAYESLDSPGVIGMRVQLWSGPRPAR
jgi:hypothetical protein